MCWYRTTELELVIFKPATDTFIQLMYLFYQTNADCVVSVLVKATWKISGTIYHSFSTNQLAVYCTAFVQIDHSVDHLIHDVPQFRGIGK